MPPRPIDRISALPAYRPGRSAAAAMADHGIASAVKLASNELALDPLPSVTKAIEAAIATAHLYPDPGAVELRRALAESVGVASEQVTVGAGSVGLLQQLALAYAGPGDEVVYGWPSFEAYPLLTALTGATKVPVPLDGQTIDAATVAAALGPQTRLVLVANPNNPTGTALTGDDLQVIADALPDGALLVVDEAYREFVTDPEVPDAVELFGHRDDVCVLRTFSKAHGLAALRVGYLIGPPDVVATVDRTLVPFAVNALGQAGAMASLTAFAEMTDRVAGVTAERQRVLDALRADGWPVEDSQANFTWLPVGDRSTALGLALEQAGLVTRVFAGVGVRVTVGTPADNDRFLDVCRSLPARTAAGLAADPANEPTSQPGRG
ncbi:MAG: histidinol-phosphate transaminase [Aquihabitans sp.]